MTITKREALERIENELGVTEDQFLEEFGMESIVPAVCMECGVVHDNLEPDCDGGYCDACDTHGSLRGGLVLLGVL